MERIMIEIMITRKNRREPTLILQSANDVTNKIAKRSRKERHFIWYFIQFLASTELNLGIKRFSRDQGSGLATILDQVSKCYGQNVRSVGKIYLVKTLLYNKTM